MYIFFPTLSCRVLCCHLIFIFLGFVLNLSVFIFLCYHAYRAVSVSYRFSCKYITNVPYSVVSLFPVLLSYPKHAVQTIAFSIKFAINFPPYASRLHLLRSMTRKCYADLFSLKGFRSTYPQASDFEHYI